MKPLDKMSFTELKEAQLKQKTLLSNDKLLKSLPDKGKKLVDSLKKIDERLKNMEQLTDMLGGLELSESRVDTNKMEWTGNIPAKSLGSPKPSSSALAEEDETDIVSILLTSNETDKIIVKERKDDCTTKMGKTFKPEKFIQNLIERVEHAQVSENQFRPYSTLAQEPSIIRQQGPPSKKSTESHKQPMWENTAATPPKMKFEKGIVELNIEQSLQIQYETDEKLRNIESQFSSLKIGKKSTPLEFAAYSGDNKINPEEEETEVYDDDHVPEMCVVVSNNIVD